MTVLFEPGIYIDRSMDNCVFTVLKDLGPASTTDPRLSKSPSTARIVYAIRMWHGVIEVGEWFFHDRHDFVRVDL